MRVVRPDASADAPTMALPVQPPAQQPDPNAATQRIKTDRVQPGAVPLSKPPSTPRPAPGPKQAGAQRGPAPDQPAEPRRVASAPSPADVQPTRPAQSLGEQRPIAPPQRIEPQQQGGAKKPGKRLLLAAGAVVVVLALVAAAVALLGGGDSAETQVRAAIDDYTSALRDGDLATLRTSTCGELQQFYQGISEDEFAGVHQASVQSGNIPVVESVDAVRVTDATALAQATVSTQADPNTKTERTFDLQRTDAGWKVCEPASGTP